MRFPAFLGAESSCIPLFKRSFPNNRRSHRNASDYAARIAEAYRNRICALSRLAMAANGGRPPESLIRAPAPIAPNPSPRAPFRRRQATVAATRCRPSGDHVRRRHADDHPHPRHGADAHPDRSRASCRNPRPATLVHRVAEGPALLKGRRRRGGVVDALARPRGPPGTGRPARRRDGAESGDGDRLPSRKGVQDRLEHRVDRRRRPGLQERGTGGDVEHRIGLLQVFILLNRIRSLLVAAALPACRPRIH